MGLQCGPPSVIRWFINLMNTLVIGTINHSYWRYVHQLSYRKRVPHFVVMVNDGIFHGENHPQNWGFHGIGRRPIQMVSHWGISAANLPSGKTNIAIENGHL